MIFITVKFTVRPEHSANWLALVDDFTQATRREPGNLFFEWSRSVDNPHQFVLVEAFRDAEAGGDHVASVHFKAAMDPCRTPSPRPRRSSAPRSQASPAGIGWGRSLPVKYEDHYGSGGATAAGHCAVRELADLTITKIVVGPMDNNAYLLRCKATGQQLLIDAAAEPGTLLQRAGTDGLTAVVTTHRHSDHWQALRAVVVATGARTTPAATMRKASLGPPTLLSTTGTTSASAGSSSPPTI